LALMSTTPTTRTSRSKHGGAAPSPAHNTRWTPTRCLTPSPAARPPRRGTDAPDTPGTGCGPFAVRLRSAAVHCGHPGHRTAANIRDSHSGDSSVYGHCRPFSLTFAELEGIGETGFEPVTAALSEQISLFVLASDEDIARERASTAPGRSALAMDIDQIRGKMFPVCSPSGLPRLSR